jgi:hypothetical protein
MVGPQARQNREAAVWLRSPMFEVLPTTPIMHALR